MQKHKQMSGLQLNHAGHRGLLLSWLLTAAHHLLLTQHITVHVYVLCWDI